jgi:hypothetical protein
LNKQPIPEIASFLTTLFNEEVALLKGSEEKIRTPAINTIPPARRK